MMANTLEVDDDSGKYTTESEIARAIAWAKKLKCRCGAPLQHMHGKAATPLEKTDKCHKLDKYLLNEKQTVRLRGLLASPAR